MDKLLKRLSSMVYRSLKKKGVPVPTEQYQKARIKSAAKGEWGEIKIALLEEIGAAVVCVCVGMYIPVQRHRQGNQ